MLYLRGRLAVLGAFALTSLACLGSEEHPSFPTPSGAAADGAGECVVNESLQELTITEGEGDATAPKQSRAEDAQANSAPEPYHSERIQAIRQAIDNPFSLIGYRANYLLPVAYRHFPEEDSSIAAARYSVRGLKPSEMQFQLSLQLPVFSGFWGENSFLSFAYTNRSFWQAYAPSSPFREINHEVELLATWVGDWEAFGFRNIPMRMGISHQSNGRGDIYSRGWNRIYADFTFEKGRYFLNLKPWYLISVDREVGRSSEFGTYFGNFEVTGGYSAGGYTSSIMLRNNLKSENFGAVELSWGFPIAPRVRGVVKYFDGYGESLIDYSTRVQMLGVGVMLVPAL